MCYCLPLQNLPPVENADATDPDIGNAAAEANRNNEAPADLGPNDVARADTAINLDIGNSAIVSSIAAISLVNSH